MNHAFRSLLLSSMLLAIAIPATCETPRRVALLLGNWDYNANGNFDSTKDPFPYLSDLENPCKDIALVKEKLVKFGFEVSDHCNSSRDKFEDNIEHYFANLGELPDYSTVIVYYSGHGVQQRTSMFTIPVGFKDAPLSVVDGDSLLRHYDRNANSIRRLRALLPRNLDIANIIIFDNCRSQATIEDENVHDSLVTINMPPNTLVQYATTATKTTLDNGKFAEMLAQELETGDPINLAIGRLGSKIWRDYRAGSRDTYAESIAGEAFKELGRLSPLREVPSQRRAASTIATSTAARPENGTERTKGTSVRRADSKAVSDSEPSGQRALTNQGISQTTTIDATGDETSSATEQERKKVVFSNYRGNHPSVDILWCVGPGDKARLAHARFIAAALASRAEEFGIGRVRTVPLSERENKPGRFYNVRMNVMRYDESEKQELPLLKHIAAEFADYGFLPARGIGVGGHATTNYVSVFVCGEQPPLASQRSL